MNIEKITQGKNLTDTERTVLEYILDHLDTVQTEGVRGVARANYTSTSTIMRLARKMNYSGFVDMCYKLRSFTETPHQTMQEEEDFLNGFSTQSLLNYNTYTQLKVCAEKLLEQRDKMTFVYGTGFSGTVATYLTQKLVNMGILCFSATGGEQQRVAIARALINNPTMIIADEPTGNLDPARSFEIMLLLEQINALGTTVMVVTHEKSLVDRFTKRVVAINNGKVISDGMDGYYNYEEEQ